MGIVVSNKVITPAKINCGGFADITLALTAAPEITSNPVDIMLVLDRSGSMADEPLAALKTSAMEFVDIIREATNPGGTNIGGASRIGIVSFADDATLDVPLTQDVSVLNTGINALIAEGFTNHAAAFDTAAANYLPVLTPPNKKILVMFTDGDTTVGGNPNTAAANARAAGITIYCIGLGTGINVNNLNNWATDPDNTHVIIAPTPQELDQAFEDLAANITNIGAIGIEVVDTVEDDFEIVGIPITVQPISTNATFSISPDKKSITWKLDELGVSTSESATITFKVKYTGTIGGIMPINSSVTYTDEHDPPNQVNFTPNIFDITVDCLATVNPDCCQDKTDITFEECTDVIEVDLPKIGDGYDLKCNGRILILGIRLKNVCPHRRIALGVIAHEIINDAEYERGFAVVTVPALPTPTAEPPCTDITVKPITFVFPEGLENESTNCESRTFRIKVIVHYIDIGLSNRMICD